MMQKPIEAQADINAGTGMLPVKINKANIFEERRTAERAVRGAGIIPQIAIGVLQIIRHTDRFFGSVI